MNNKELGSSTLVITTLDNSNNTLKSALIGDSGFFILREKKEEIKNDENKNKKNKNYEIFYKSKEQTHSFNFPYQLGTNGTGGDHPNSAVLKEHQIEENDIIILCTDGLLDNMFNEWVLETVKKYFMDNQNFCPNKLAEDLGNIAYKISLNTEIFTPFAETAMKSKYKYKGGKSDDITVVVARVQCHDDN